MGNCISNGDCGVVYAVAAGLIGVIFYTVMSTRNRIGTQSWKFPSEDRLVKVVSIVRHGARGPSNGSLKPFRNAHNEDPKNFTPITEWKDGEIENITKVGNDQLYKIGQWFGSRYQDFLTEDEKKTGVSRESWWSSSVGRVIESGDDFWKGFCAVTGKKTPVQSKYTEETKDANHHFKAWNVDKRYTDRVAKVKSGELFTQKGQEEAEFLDSLLSRCAIDTAALSSAAKVSSMTYFREIVECEKYFMDENRKTEKNALTALLSKKDEEKINELAHWVWDKRFFLYREEWKHIIGGRLLKQMTKDMKENRENKLSIYTGHDYSILSLLCAMGVEAYPHPLFSFGAYVIFEVYEAANTGVPYVKLIINNTPFEDEEEEPTHELRENNIELKLPYFSGENVVSLDALYDYAFSLPE